MKIWAAAFAVLHVLPHLPYQVRANLAALEDADPGVVTAALDDAGPVPPPAPPPPLPEVPDGLLTPDGDVADDPTAFFYGGDYDAAAEEDDGFAPPAPPPGGLNTFLDEFIGNLTTYWHDITQQAHLRDYTPRSATLLPEFKVPGPCYTSRVFAMAHIAMYDAYAALQSPPLPTYYEYNSLPTIRSGLFNVQDQWTAIAEAAYRVLISKSAYNTPSHHAALMRAYVEYFQRYPRSVEGRKWGQTVAAAVIADREDDGWDSGEPFVVIKPRDGVDFKPYEHRPDPTYFNEDGEPQDNYAPHWGEVRPFVLGSKITEKLPRLPDPKGLDYLTDWAEVMLKGERFSNDSDTEGERTKAELQTGLYWAYDGALYIGVPVRMYNRAIEGMLNATQAQTEDRELAARGRSGRVLVTMWAAANAAMADAAIAAWFEKYDWNFWRPIIGIRNAETDSYPSTEPAKEWEPYGAPKTYTEIPFPSSPDFPAYPSGHATIGTAGMRTAEKLLQLPAGFKFNWISEELQIGENNPPKEPFDVNGPRMPEVRDTTVTEAVEENNASRVYIGVHWRFDATEGSMLGEELATKLAASFPARV